MPVEISPGVFAETVADIIGEGPAPEVKPFEMPVLDDYPVETYAPGIYFDMPNEVYQASPALSASGIKKLAASPMLYYAKCPWLNPDYTPPEAKDYFDIGEGYHARILEGPEAFRQRFAIGLDKKDYPNALDTMKDIRAAWPHGITPKGTSKRECFNNLLAYDATVELWEDILAEHAQANEGKTMIDAKTCRLIEIGAAMIEKDPELSQLISGGYPEVSLFWTCPRTGIPKKARVDKLKVRMMVDLKSVANTKEQRMENVVRLDIANRRYALAPSHYFQGAAEVRKLVRAHGDAVIHGDDEQAAWAKKWAAHTVPDEWAWVYIQKGDAPVARGLFYPRAGSTKMLFDDMCSMMSKRFRQFAEHHGAGEPWIDSSPIYDLADEDLPDWSKDI